MQNHAFRNSKLVREYSRATASMSSVNVSSHITDDTLIIRAVCVISMLCIGTLDVLLFIYNE